MKEGDVILTQIPRADGTVKTRPALVLRELPPFQDLLVCGISTQTHQAVPGFDEVSTTGKAGGLISPKRAAILATLKGYPPLGITLRIIGLLPCSDY